jgi:beta-galactosidase
VPYLVTEAVGARDGTPNFRWFDPAGMLAKQAVKHAQVHEIALSDPRYAGLLGWAGFDYASLNGHIWCSVKWPGVSDTFRVPKPGAAVYRSQVDPSVRAVIIPVFFWDFGPASPPDGPGPGAMIATNCDRLEIFVGGRRVATGRPDRTRFGHLAYPPVFTDLVVLGPSGLLNQHGLPAEDQRRLLAEGGRLPELRIDGYVGSQLTASVSASADTALDRLALAADDAAIQADGSDATRMTFRAVDAYGNQRPFVAGEVTLSVSGPAEVLGDNPFAFGAYGGVGGAFVRSLPGRTGPVTVTASHPVLGSATVRITVTPPAPGRQLL